MSMMASFQQSIRMTLCLNDGPRGVMKTILIADDEEAIRALVIATLGNSDAYTLLSAGDGESALQLIREAVPDLVFLDVMMPGRNGIDVCREIKSDPALKHIKVVMLTALGAEEDRQRALDAGASDYFTKPFSPTKLLQKVRELLDE